MATAARDCLRLIGDACVYVYGWANVELSRVSKTRILPVVDSGFSSQRERLLQRLLSEALAPELAVIRGGVVGGYRGFGKSQLVRQLVLGKELVQWCIGSQPYNQAKHVGMYVDNPSQLGNALRMGCPPALLAAGFCNADVLKRESPPAWAVSSGVGFKPKDVAEWVSQQKLNAVLVVDEF